ncbi:uncharacterized protein LY79DRAFT_574061 [Colletotrichum navitas]|uniref:Uncharacterized protein n=1 Tax=Colletotrichum navitas TaxID=681940 RepID=A0AAD8PJ16_9PEZI|nr:uncharacterized protein LY79DRAFT_574061 [Colletotrichum navitas]KAK1561595.1 hypothetical protein LY79DRAFT_574061 [Colletotrichum navitas]
MEGQDAFVKSTLTHDDTPKRLIDAAAASGVYSNSVWTPTTVMSMGCLSSSRKI